MRNQTGPSHPNWFWQIKPGFKPRKLRRDLSGNSCARQSIKTRGGRSPNDEAAIKLLRLALRNVLAKSVRAAFDWNSAMNQFAILCGERFTLARG